MQAVRKDMVVGVSVLETIEIPLKQLHPNPANPRVADSSADAIADMAKSLVKRQVQPIVVRRIPPPPSLRRLSILRLRALAEEHRITVPEDGASKADIVADISAAWRVGYEVICGHQRRLAAIHAGLPTLRAEVVDVDTLTGLRMALVENSARNSVSPIAESDAIAALLEGGADAAELDAEMGYGPQWMRNRIVLRNACDGVRSLLLEKAIGLRSAVALSVVSQERQEQAVEDLCAKWEYQRNKKISHIDVTHWLAGHLLRDAVWALDDATLGAQACSKCPLRSDRQQDLFANTAGRPLCLDRPCWTSKEDVFAQRMAEAGHLVEAKDSESVYNRRDLMRESAPGGVTPADWAAVLEATSVIVFRSQGRLSRVRRTSDVIAALGARGLTDAADHAQQWRDGPSRAPETKDDEIPQRSSREVRAELFAAHTQMLEGLSPALQPEVLRLILAGLIQNGRLVPMRAIAKRRGVEWIGGEYLAELPAAELPSLLVDVAFQEPITNAASTHSRGMERSDAWPRLMQLQGVGVPESAFTGS